MKKDRDEYAGSRPRPHGLLRRVRGRSKPRLALFSRTPRVLLTHFDRLEGPVPFLYLGVAPMTPRAVGEITRLLDFLSDEGYFLFADATRVTVNHVFQVDAPGARGEMELAMLTVVYPGPLVPGFNPAPVRRVLARATSAIRAIENVAVVFQRVGAPPDRKGTTFRALVTRVSDLFRRLLQHFFHLPTRARRSYDQTRPWPGPRSHEDASPPRARART